MGVLTIVQDFAFVAASGQSFNTPWIAFPAEHERAQIVVICKSRVSGTLLAQMQTTWDTDSESNVGSAASVNAQGTTITDITTGLGPMIRFNLAGSAADTIMVISIYVTPKSS